MRRRNDRVTPWLVGLVLVGLGIGLLIACFADAHHPMVVTPPVKIHKVLPKLQPWVAGMFTPNVAISDAPAYPEPSSTVIINGHAVTDPVGGSDFQ